MAHSRKKPELLSPAGSPEALEAAIEAGADAVYFGGASFSNRMRAKNFGRDEIKEAIRLCCGYGVASHITMNTRLRDRELGEALETARELWSVGASAFIVADLGFASLLKKEIPEAVLHGSTQLTGVSSADAEAMKALGISRMVCPRELSERELLCLTAESPIEIEMFIHGALCVSVSGQCLMSWAQGGRSGNRGECAQPCRLPYSLNGEPQRHLLSLRDSCLAGHIPEILKLGVASLKIEGRMKGADYVYGVTKIYRRLLDEERSATESEIRELDALFSRDGFTDGYFTGKMGLMNGMRQESAASVGGVFGGLKRTLPIKAELRAPLGGEMALSFSDGELKSEVKGGSVSAAERAPATVEGVFKNISKLGGTPFSLDAADFSFTAPEGVFLPASSLNELRRKAVSSLTEQKAESLRLGKSMEASVGERKTAPCGTVRFAEFSSAGNIPEGAYGYFDGIFLPYGELRDTGASLALSPWQADPKEDEKILREYKNGGGSLVLCHTLGQIRAAKACGLSPVASFRLNVSNGGCADVISCLGADYTVLSPELPTAAMRDIARGRGGVGAVVYGHLPLMLLKRCVLKSVGCSGECGGAGCAEGARLTDRRGGDVTVLSSGGGTNELLNSHVIWSADRMSETRGLDLLFFIFKGNSRKEAENVIRAYRDGLSSDAAGIKKIKRM